uniref:SWIM-type domain-containing protein n=1 Tax=Cannabis sativa TaxID=3483 RepID=A0A803PYD3_CANSA
MLTEAVSDLGLVVEPTVGLVDGAGCSEPSLCGGDGVGCSRPNITNDIEDSFDDEAAYEYEGDPEYEQCHDDLIVDETAEIHLKGLGKRPMDIDMEDAQLDDFDNEYIQQNSSSSEEDTDDELKNLHKCKRSSMKAKLPKLPEFNVDVDMKNPSFEVGLVFSSGKEFKDAVREYAIMNGKEIFFKVNDSHRVRAKCRGIQCPWMCFASKINSDSSTFAIKSYIDVHKCSRKKHNRFATAKWFSNKYLTEFKSNENWKISSFMEKVSKDHVIDISRDKAYKARKLATKKIEGSYDEQYAALWDYAEEIKYTNKGSTIEFVTEVGDNGNPRFKRMYICFAGLRDGFNAGCRPLIGLDGCHIKGPHKGQLLTAIGIDADNGIYPVAFAVVEIENKETWNWFLQCLRVDLKIENSNHWTFITDKQKGLQQSLKDMWEEGIPEAEHRHCARHLEKNFIKVFRDKKLKDLLWKAAREVTIPRFQAAMEEIKQLDKAAYDWLMEAGPQHWSRIRIYLLKRLTKNRHSALMWESNIAPRIQEILEKNKDIASGHISLKSSDFIYQIQTMYGSLYYVNLKEMKCSCRKWDLTGIPCSHAVAAIWNKHGEPENYVSKWYTKEYYLKAYGHQIFPIRNQDQWPKSGKVGLVKPISKVQPGRPKRSRKLEFDEMVPPTGTKMKRRYIIIKCSGCGAKGHNFRTCVRNKEKNSDVNPSDFTQEINNVAPRYKQKTGKKKIVTSQFGQLGQEVNTQKLINFSASPMRRIAARSFAKLTKK